MAVPQKVEQVPKARRFEDGSHPLATRSVAHSDARSRARALGVLAALGCMLACAQPALSEEVKDYGKPGSPVDLVVGYQPYYTQAWSGVIMRSKKFYEKYLPQGSKVDFQVGLQGAIIVNGMLAGKVDIGYVGDMPGIV